jgi:PPIC-type PPIASE domain protein
MIKGKKYLKKQVVASVLALSMAAASLTGCSNGLSSSKKESSNVGTMTQEEASTTKVMVIGDYDIYMDELLVYAIQAMVTNNGTLASVKANPDTYKEQTLSLIRTTKILYDVTQHNDVTLDDSDMETTNNTINNFLKSMPDGLLEKYGISEDVVRKVFTEQTYVSKFENDIKNDMGKTIQDDVEEKVKDYNFMVFDYILFPTVETTEDDTPATNTDGSYKYVDDAAKQKAKENAEALLKELEAGGDAETLATKYGVSNYYFERTGYVGSFTDSINKAVENMKAGDCSGVLEEKLGYAVIHMKSDHDEELLKNYAYAVASDTVDDQFDKLEEQWLSTIEVDPEKDMEGTVWADYDLSGLAQSLADGGLLNGASSTSSAGSN